MSESTNKTSQAPCPPEVAAGVVKVLGNVRSLSKSDHNKHGGYQFASIDAFLAAIGPLCADAGIFIAMDELDAEVSGKTLSCRFGFTVVHSSGAVWNHQFSRTVAVNALGAQAYGSAQSYALKQFLRALFMVPTGDQDDPDHQPAGPLPEGRSARKVDPEAQARAEIRAEALAVATAIGDGSPANRRALLESARDACNLPADGEVDAQGWQCILDKLNEKAAEKAGDEFLEEFGPASGDPPQLFGGES